MKRTKQEILTDIRKLKANPDSYVNKINRSDPYSVVAQHIIDKVPNSTIFKDMSFKEIRTYTKDPLMTVFYNSVQEPINAFGEDSDELHAFYATLNELFPGALNVMEALNNAWDSNAMFHEVTAPDGHVAHIKVMETIDGHLDNEGLDLPYRYKLNKPSENGTSIVANFTHICDGFIVRYCIDNAPFQVTHIHDDYQCHPNNMHALRKLYIEAFEVLANSKILEIFCNQDFGIDRSELLRGLNHSEYALC